MVKTYNDFYLEARRTLKAAGVEAFGLEARLLLAAAADKRPEEFLRDIRLYPAQDYEERASSYLQRRLAGEPVAYITGSWSFYGLELEINSNVLIPRSDTELSVDAALCCLAGLKAPRVLDLCCGSGCIGLAIASRIPDCRLLLADKDRRALLLAQRNARRCGLHQRAACLEADLLSAPPPQFVHFHLLVCNPPYIPTQEIPRLDRSVRDFEPWLALDGGEDGLLFYRCLFARWLSALEPGGKLVLECGEGQSDPICRMAEAVGLRHRESMVDSLGTERTLIFEKAAASAAG